MAAHGNDFHIVGERKFNGHFRKYASALFAGHHNGREHLRPQTETLDKGNVPSTAAGIEEFRSGGDGILAAGTAAEIEAEEVGHEEETLRGLHEFRLFAEHGLQLVDGIDIHHLHACLGIVGIGIVLLHEGFAQTVGAAVAIAYGETDKVVAIVDEGEVHTPGIHTDTADTEVGTLGSTTDAFLHVGKERRKVPIYMVPYPYLTVGKAVYFLCLQPAVDDISGHNASGTSTEIGCKKCVFHGIKNNPSHVKGLKTE